jgi:crotonobetainyl-CoA:carnitine CoA-transferase CaiB-like acyl-CoA transferase
VAGPLEGICIVDLTQYAAGPLCTSLLADQGAEVWKIEPPRGGDPLRHMGSQVGGVSSIFAVLNRGKRSLAIDVAQPQGAELVRRLALRADVFAQSLRPGVAERLGLGSAALRARNPRLVYLSLCGWGETGPLAGRRAYDSLVQAHSGMSALQAGGDGVPQMVGSAICDKLTGVYAAQAVSAALLARERGAGGQEISLSMLDASLAFLWSDGMQDVAWSSTAHPSPRAQRPGVHATADGFATFTAHGEAQRAGLRAALGSDDPREVARRAAALPTDELLARLAAHDVPAARVNRPADLFSDPQVAANDVLRAVEIPGAGALRQPRHAARFAKTPACEPLPCPALGEHTDSVLAGLGLAHAELEALRVRGVIG